MTLLLFGMCAVAFYMADSVLTDYMSSRYAVSRISAMFGAAPEDVSYVTMLNNTASIGESDAVREYLLEHAKVMGCGYFNEQAALDLMENKTVNIIISDISLMQMGNLKLSDAQKQRLLDDDSGYQPVLLGWEYQKQVEAGAVFTLSWVEEKDCIVAGFLPKGAAWPKKYKLFGGTGATDSYNLDNRGILLTKNYEGYTNTLGAADLIYYIAQPGAEEQVRQDVKRFAIEKGLSIGVNNAGEQIAAEKLENHISDDKTFLAALLLSLLAVISISASSVIYCLLNRKQYGVMMVCGLRQRDLIWMIVVQNAIIIVLSAIAGWIVKQVQLFGGLVPQADKRMFELMFLRDFIPHDVYMPFVLLLLSVVMLVVSSVLPARVIRRTALINLLYRKE